MTQNERTLAQAPIGKLLFTYAMPSIIGLMAGSLYNVADQIFIGIGLGFLGNAATTVCYPIVVVSDAISLLLANGCAAFISLKMGEGKTETARASFGKSLTALAVFGILSSVFFLIFLKPMLTLFGSTDAIYPYARDYATIILLGMPVNIVRVGLSNVIRVDGSPRYAMGSMLAGVLCNLLLDPLFIFVFGWGIRGAAWATVLSQVVSFVVSARYFAGRARSITLRRRDLGLNPTLLLPVMRLGLPSFAHQFAIMAVNIVLNNAMRFYGAQSVYGSEIALSCCGIMMKVGAIMVNILIGISAGAQPILGYNFGAGCFSRVKKAYFIAVKAATLVAVANWLLIMLLPRQIMLLFGDTSPLVLEFGVLTLRVYLLGMFGAGFYVISSNYFQAVGKPGRSLLMALCRQLLFQAGLTLLFGHWFGIMGVLASGPVGDLLSDILAFIIIAKEMRRLNALVKTEHSRPAAQV